MTLFFCHRLRLFQPNSSLLHLTSRRMAGKIIRRIISTPKAPVPIAPYNQGVQVNETLYVSGQLGMSVAGELADGIESQTRLALDNLGYILSQAGTSYNNVVKTTVLLSDMTDFTVVNKVYEEYFRDKFPARAAYQVAALPKNAMVEIEAVAVVGEIEERN